MLTQGFSQALQILKDTCLKADEVVLQPKLADSLQMYNLSLELPMPLNKSKKNSKQDNLRPPSRIITFFFIARHPVTLKLSVLKNYKEEPRKESSHTKG